ncbi:MAG: hypothetical protein COU26_04510 [Candidatus Levybacteria bacterium CG10_big_fil_rev_8_21_14_0_10_36_30]|nr:MAG: hypothetical protein COU26_04510 [Candidatus Levybacteria bacterium CG10_big_fil_rev_8_21_14_0_10_36_30]
MATLVKITRETRILLKILAIVGSVMFILYLTVNGATLFKKIFFPTPLPPPEEKFGKLPIVSFPSQNITRIEYRINTVNKTLPASPDRMKVYKTREFPPILGALQDVRDKLKKLDYKLFEKRISDTKSSWTNSNGETITYDIYRNNFQIKSNFIANPPLKVYEQTAKKDEISRFIFSFLANVGIDTSDIDTNLTTVKYFKLSSGTLIPVDNQFEAQVARVDLFQNDLSENGLQLKMYYPNNNQSIMYFYLANVDGIQRIIEAGFTHNVVDKNMVTTYPIKTTQQAFDDLQAGKAFVFLDNPGSKSLDLIEVFLGYYFSDDETQSYTVPIYVFKGNGFTAYVNAVPDTSIGN